MGMVETKQMPNFRRENCNQPLKYISCRVHLISKVSREVSAGVQGFKIRLGKEEEMVEDLRNILNWAKP